MRAASYSEAVESRQTSRAPERFEVVGKDPHPPTCGRRPLSPAGCEAIRPLPRPKSRSPCVGTLVPLRTCEQRSGESRVTPNIAWRNHQNQCQTNAVDSICFCYHNLVVPTDVVATDEFVEWYDDLDDRSRKSVTRVVDLLEQTGTALRHPHSSQIKGSRTPCVSCASKAAGVRSASSIYSMRVARPFLLVGGDKTGDARFYLAMVPFAEAIWEQYQAEREREK